MELNDYHIKYAKQWLDISIDALKSLHKKNRKEGFIQTSTNRTPPQDIGLFPTASFQAYSSLFNCNSNDYCKEFDTVISRDDIIKKCINSSLNKEDRSIILCEPILSCLFMFLSLKKNNEFDKNKKLDEIIKLDEIKNYIWKSKNYFYPEVGASPWFLLTLLTCNEYVEKLYNKKIIDKNWDELDALIDNHINYHMARYNTKELSFDPISLIIAICCKIKVDVKIKADKANTFKKSPFFISCLNAIVSQQNDDGSWPTGATISFSKSGDVIQQTSIQITSYLADSLIDYKFLVDCDDNTEKILKIIIPSFRKLAQYMEYTYERVPKTNICGWSSERIKQRNFTETWITAYACKFFYKYYLAEKAYARIQALKELGIDNFVYNSQKNNEHKELWDKIIEPDSILKPKEKINNIIEPIYNKRDKGELIIRPEEKLSFIICGPPGSGKTHIIKAMAKRLGWPLVELSPSQFINKGLELIESRSKEIFNHLSLLHHAVVFFDECDELFKERENKEKEKNEKSETRTILNFLTASMLPKLQDLHDKGNIIFVVGTNFLHNIDKAVRRGGRFDHLILYDRPDEDARKGYYLNNSKDNNIVKASDFARNTKMYDYTQLKTYLKERKDASIDDYIDWCKENASKEIEAAGYKDSQKEAKIKQWQDIINKK